ncbi:MAG: PepSY domain-containing protein [Nostoc sp.]
MSLTPGKTLKHTGSLSNGRSLVKPSSWLGLIGGALLCIAGLTGSVLVFWHQIDHIVLAQRFGHIIPGVERVSIPAIADTLKIDCKVMFF